jgi:hypothetical protein
VAKSGRDRQVVRKATAIAELEKAADQFERKALDGRYTLAKEVRDYYQDKPSAARREADILKGEDMPEPDPVTRAVAVSAL